MPIAVSCSQCEKKLKVKDEAAGKKVRCPGCSSVIQVPQAAEPEVDELEEFDDDFEVRRPQKKNKRRTEEEFDDGEDDFGAELPARSKPSGKGSKKGKGKVKARSGSSQGFLLEFYEGRLSEIMTYVFWGIFGVTLALAPFSKVTLAIYFGTLTAIVWLRSLIILFWWARICAATSSLGVLIYIAFFMFPIIGLIFGAANNELCEKPNRMFMYSIGIVVLTWVVGFLAIAAAISVLGVKL